MAKILIELERCVGNKDGTKCPYCTEKLTKGYGYATDYMCSKMGNKITSLYVEWNSEIKPIPDWCPIMVKPE